MCALMTMHIFAFSLFFETTARRSKSLSFAASVSRYKTPELINKQDLQSYSIVCVSNQVLKQEWVCGFWVQTYRFIWAPLPT